MKKLLLILILLISLTSQSQIEYSAFIPMRTHHWNRTPYIVESYCNTEGGTYGVIAVRKSRKNSFFTSTGIGLIQNSYDKPSIVLQQGIGKTIKNIDISLSVGLASGYEDLYKDNDRLATFPKILVNNSIMPVSLIIISYTKYKIQPTFNISPYFINGGIIYRISK